MIEMKKLRELVKLMKQNDLVELDLRDAEEQITLKRPGPPPQVVQPAPPAMPPAAPPVAGQQAPAPPTEAGPTGGEGQRSVAEQGLVEITSPMVGTYYSSPSPDADPFVRVGSTVDEETVVCMIEAMKVFNEIKAELSGTIEKILVGNGQAVEFGQPLFLVRPA
jgi:acetyl-CoA carboxylase biotin carboxyl carrier protein